MHIVCKGCYFKSPPPPPPPNVHMPSNNYNVPCGIYLLASVSIKTCLNDVHIVQEVKVLLITYFSLNSLIILVLAIGAVLAYVFREQVNSTTVLNVVLSSQLIPCIFEPFPIIS